MLLETGLIEKGYMKGVFSRNAVWPERCLLDAFWGDNCTNMPTSSPWLGSNMK